MGKSYFLMGLLGQSGTRKHGRKGQASVLAINEVHLKEKNEKPDKIAGNETKLEQAIKEEEQFAGENENSLVRTRRSRLLLRPRLLPTPMPAWHRPQPI